MVGKSDTGEPSVRTGAVMKAYIAAIAGALVLTGCASEPKLATGSLRTVRPTAHAAKPMTADDAKRVACRDRHAQYQRGEAPWGAKTADAVRAGDDYCHDAMMESPKSR
jgi:hypothetical protein